MYGKQLCFYLLQGILLHVVIQVMMGKEMD